MISLYSHVNYNVKTLEYNRINLHDTNQNFIPKQVIPERVYPGSRTESKFSFRNEV